METVPLELDGISVFVTKITGDELSNEEKEIGVFKQSPIIGAKLSAADYFSYISGHYSSYQKMMTPSEVGCTLAHLEIYKRLLNSRFDGVVIFEKDIDISRESIGKIKSLLAELKPGFIHLGWYPAVFEGRFFTGRVVDVINGQQVYEVDPSNGFYGAFSYYVSRETARMLLDFNSAFLHRADEWRRFFNQYNVKPLFSGVVSHPREGVSDIADRSRVAHPRIRDVQRRKLERAILRVRGGVLGLLKGYRKITSGYSG